LGATTDIHAHAVRVANAGLAVTSVASSRKMKLRRPQTSLTVSLGLLAFVAFLGLDPSALGYGLFFGISATCRQGHDRVS
jgi:hypothetical protein